jgi:DNA-binding CsgD family transcriptional regulator
VLTIVNGVQGQMTDALPLFERALTVTEGEPALTDLRILLQINQAVTLGNLDQYDEAIGAARQALYLADQAGTSVRRVQAHSALGELLFDTGRWPEALAEVEALDEDLKDAMAACCDLGIAAAIRFHRGDLAAACANLAAAAPYAEKTGNQVIGSLLLARSLDREHAGEPAEALAALTAGFAENTEELDEIEDLLPDAVRLATATGDLGKARELAGHAAALASGAEIAHRQATALYCRGLLEHDTVGLLTAAERYSDAGRPLLSAKALEAAAVEFLGGEDRDQARASFIKAVEVYTSLGAAADVARLQASFRAHGIRRGPTAKHRQARSGWDSLTPTETKVAALVVEGLSNPEIATKLLLSRRTVATHVSHILRKLGVNSRIDIARESALRTSTPE